eukprot:8432404-Pyramimonas_sp.AAC.1
MLERCAEVHDEHVALVVEAANELVHPVGEMDGGFDGRNPLLGRLGGLLLWVRLLPPPQRAPHVLLKRAA